MWPTCAFTLDSAISAANLQPMEPCENDVRRETRVQRRRRRSVASTKRASLVFGLSVTTSILCGGGADAFATQSRRRSVVLPHDGPLHRSSAPDCITATSSTQLSLFRIPWGERRASSTSKRRASKADDDSQRRSSPFEVRKRVKSVLKRAFNRTGVRNSSASSAIADAASLGGLGDGTPGYSLQMRSSISRANGKYKNGINGDANGTPRPISEDDLEWRRDPRPEQNGVTVNVNVNVNGSVTANSASMSKPPEIEAINGDIPAATDFVESAPVHEAPAAFESSAVAEKPRVEDPATVESSTAAEKLTTLEGHEFEESNVENPAIDGLSNAVETSKNEDSPAVVDSTSTAKKPTVVETYKVEDLSTIAESANVAELPEVEKLSPVVESSTVSEEPHAAETPKTVEALSDMKETPKAVDETTSADPVESVVTKSLPFKLPQLSDEIKARLAAGERVQEQTRMGREGSGYVVLDVSAPPYVVWECLLDFESYPEIIPTVRDMQLFTNEKLNYGYVNEKRVSPKTGRETRHYGTPSITRAAFTLSKFKLKIAAIHTYTPHPDGDYMVFTLDPSCTNVILKGAKGIWYTEANPDGREGVTRVYLLCEIQISRALPKFIVDYAADRAMPRATTWLKPQVEAAADLWLKKPDT